MSSLQVQPSPRPYFERIMGIKAKPCMQIPENKWDFVASCIKIGISNKRGAADWSRLICGWTSFVGEFWALAQINCMIVKTALILDTGKLQNSLKTADLHEVFPWLICVVVLFTQTTILLLKNTIKLKQTSCFQVIFCSLPVFITAECE